jgi:lysine 2,3-aminomutase
MKMSDIINLEEKVRKEFGITVQDYFNYLRLSYLKAELNKTPFLRQYLKKVLGKEPEQTITAPDLGKTDNWADIKFHLKHRITKKEELVKILGIIEESYLADVLGKGYSLSVLPLNLAIGNKDLLNKFLPKPDFFLEHAAKYIDPYGIFDKGTIVEKEGVYIGSQKFQRSLLMNITSACPIGCVGCYKGEYTRLKEKEFFTDLEKAVSIQSEKLVEYLNNNKKIQSVIMSGGEPLLLSNQGIEKILERLKHAKYLTEFRICTGTIFQGLPYRIDEELLDILKKFENESGIQVHFNAHLSHPSQFTTDALIAVHKIREKGFCINTQVPLQRNVNIFLEDRNKTMQTLYELTELQGKSGVRPYKYILHMNSGSLEYSVPLEFMLNVLGELKYRTDHPWPETWMPISVSILCKEGNMLLSPQLLLCIEKEINAEKGYIEYKIPVPADEGFKKVSYREPIIRTI